MFPREWQERTIGGQVERCLVPLKRVEESFEANRDLTVLAIVANIVWPKKSDVRNMLHTASYVIQDQGDHFGDCTRHACSCDRCRAEIYYEGAVAFQQSIERVGFQSCPAAELALATNDTVPYYHDGIYSTEEEEDQEMRERIDAYNQLSNEQKQSTATRVAQFSHWVNVELPPVPDDWPEHWKNVATGSLFPKKQ